LKDTCWGEMEFHGNAFSHKVYSWMERDKREREKILSTYGIIHLAPKM